MPRIQGKSKPASQRRPREERIASIMAAAEEEFRGNGFEKVSMARIAARAQVVEGTIYRFFDNKHDLLTKVIEAWYERMLADYARELEGFSGTRARLHFMIWRHLQTVWDSPQMCRLMFDQIRSSPGYRDTSVFSLNRMYTRRTLDIVAEGVARGELREGLDMGLVRDLIYGCVEHRTWAYLRGEGEFDPKQSADAIVSLVLCGAAAEVPGGDLGSLTDRLASATDQIERLSREKAG
ncbi:DNA-binding transcriptional regulator, AcrR family [Salinihabitans flavidus]|uniref:DNA-binding transcriptional regulator, AcrR family n=1 Tax=Salinihabitans flavidus TaxID=569882 RepID=A0A1H8PKX3_9RHOB|nr:TetR/AcrR family transcriptional regulator [Salinihabitans flavidus]SEO42364.1 DNA-binding transcriptional regulator, AcrR family [Salinihabitans flavidus]